MFPAYHFLCGFALLPMARICSTKCHSVGLGPAQQVDSCVFVEEHQNCCINLIISSLCKGKISEKQVAAGSLGSMFQVWGLYNVHQHKQRRNHVHFTACNIFPLANPRTKNERISKFLADDICWCHLQLVAQNYIKSVSKCTHNNQFCSVKLRTTRITKWF
jgi:hypothetical protein